MRTKQWFIDGRRAKMAKRWKMDFPTVNIDDAIKVLDVGSCNGKTDLLIIYSLFSVNFNENVEIWSILSKKV